jgi:uncharacterized SAM-binding protein YcdF (DUF218 family)
MKGLLSFLKQLILVALAACLVWFCGLLLFIQTVQSTPEPVINDSTETTDAIVVLTGGSERIDAGLKLLEAGKGKKLFISGVFPGVDAASLLAKSTLLPELRACCVILGHAADSTIGNAAETSVWMRQENFRSLRLVTANYHILRSLVEFKLFLPDATRIIPHPIIPDNVALADWWQRSGTARLLAHEYNKYLLSLVRAWIQRTDS